MAFDDLSGEQDVVSTSLTVDVPEQSAQNLADLNMAAAELRSNIEAIARSTQAFGDYLRTARDIGQTLRLPQMGGGGGGGGVYEGVGGRVDSSSVPDAVGALSSAAGRAEQMVSNAEGAGIGMAEQGLGGAISQRGMGGGEGPMGAMGGLTNLLFGGQMIHAAGAGTYRTIRDRGGSWIAGQAIQRGLGPVAPAVASRMALTMAARVAVPIAAVGAYYQGAEAYYQLRAKGRQFGSDAWGGWEKTFGERVMALHPAISGEEASEIYNTAIAQGYAGRGDDIFGATTEFARGNLVEMNMSVSDSFQLLQDHMDRAGGSIDTLNNILADLPELAEGSAKSMETIAQQFVQMQGFGISQGLGPTAAGNLGANTAALWGGNPALAGKTADIMRGVIGSSVFQATLASKYNLAVPQLAPSIVGDMGAARGIDLIGKETYEFLLQTAKRYSAREMGGASKEERFFVWWQEIVASAPELAALDITDLMNLFDQLETDLATGTNSFDTAIEKVNAKSDFVTKEPGFWADFGTALGLPVSRENMPHLYSPALDKLASQGEVSFIDSEGKEVKYTGHGMFARDSELDERLQAGRRGGGLDVKFGGKTYTYGDVATRLGILPGAESSFWDSGTLKISGTLVLPDGRTAELSGTGQTTPNQTNSPANLPSR